VTQINTTVPFHLGTFSTGDASRFAGIVVADRVLPLRLAATLPVKDVGALADVSSVLRILEDWDQSFVLLQRLADYLAADSALLARLDPVEALDTHPPVDLPRQIFCSGANYKRHVVELIVAQIPDETKAMSEAERYEYAVRKMDERAANGTPFVFVKAQSSVTGPFDPVVIPHDTKKADWELELGVVIGREARRVSLDDALDYVAGYTIVNDITSRDKLIRREGDLRDLGHDWTAAKCAPTYLPMGPYLTPAAFVADPQDLQITLKLNGEVKQDESTADMIFGVARLVEYLSNIVTLRPGDIICTGSPAGNGVHFGRFLQPGDVLEGSITGLGAQRNRCVGESA